MNELDKIKFKDLEKNLMARSDIMQRSLEGGQSRAVWEKNSSSLMMAQTLFGLKMSRMVHIGGIALAIAALVNLGLMIWALTLLHSHQ